MSDIQIVNIKELVDAYQFPCTLLGSGQELTIKPITTKQLKGLLVYENENDPSMIEDALDSLINEAVVTEGFNIDNLYLQDRFQLLLEIRKISKGETYSFTYVCPKCGDEVIASVNLSDLALFPTKEMEGVIEMSDTLSFKVGYPTRGDQKAATNFAKASAAPGVGNREIQLDAAIATYAKSVRQVLVNGEPADKIPVTDVIYVLENVKSEVFDRFKAWFEDNDFGVQFKSKVQCSNRHVKEVEIPLENFFI